jgi:hypothetical protein
MIQPEGVAEKHTSEFNLYMLIGFSLMFTAVLVRLWCNKQRAWVPILSIAIFGYFPILLLFGEYLPFGGVCGRQDLVFTGKFVVFGSIAILIYELIQWKRLAKKAI